MKLIKYSTIYFFFSCRCTLNHLHNLLTYHHAGILKFFLAICFCCQAECWSEKLHLANFSFVKWQINIRGLDRTRKPCREYRTRVLFTHQSAYRLLGSMGRGTNTKPVVTLANCLLCTSSDPSNRHSKTALKLNKMTNFISAVCGGSFPQEI